MVGSFLSFFGVYLHLPNHFPGSWRLSRLQSWLTSEGQLWVIKEVDAGCGEAASLR